jgi:hypothetical protein
MNLKVLIHNAALACVASCATGYAVGPGPNVELIAAGLEEHVGRPNDRVALMIYQGDASKAVQKANLSLRDAVKRLSLPRAGIYRFSFESHEPDEEGATSCAASAQLQVVPEQSYRVAFSVPNASVPTATVKRLPAPPARCAGSKVRRRTHCCALRHVFVSVLALAWGLLLSMG